MPVVLKLLKSTYFDSVYLMGIGGRLAKQPGVSRNAVLMATPANQELLVEFGVPADALTGAGATDLAVAVDAETPELGEAALALVDGWLVERTEEYAGDTAATLDGALRILPDANLAVISVPGEYAAAEARRALEQGLHVFVFSDNVSIEDELALKQLAAGWGLLVMGPDCGTSIIGGAGIGFANVVRRGMIGIVGPSGTGIQQVSCLIDRAGAGVSHAIGTGSHDLSDAIGGITTLQALDALAEDEQTEVIVVVSKPAGPVTRQKVLDWIARSPKPVVTCFLGLEETPKVGERHTPERTLLGAAMAAVRYSGVPEGPKGKFELLGGDRVRHREHAWAVRGLFAGGTHCYEAQQIFLAHGIDIRSNAPLRPDLALANAARSAGHSLIDLGDDLFTRGRPHPMIDATLRNERIIAEAADPQVAVIVLDFILGHGAAADPAGDSLPAIREAQRIADNDGGIFFIANVCGTAADPQDLSSQERMLNLAGVYVVQSSTAAAELAASIVGIFDRSHAAV